MFLVAVGLAALACADQPTDLGEGLTANLALAPVFPALASNQAMTLDAWQVQVIRPGQGVIAEGAGAVTPTQTTIMVSLTVTLQSECEDLIIRIELSGGGEVQYRSEASSRVCAGGGNQPQTPQLEWVGPVIGLSPADIPVSLLEGSSPVTRTLTVTNQGGGTLNWTATDNGAWLSLSPTSGSLGPGQSQPITVTVTGLDLNPGVHQAPITVSAPEALNSPQTVAVTLQVTPGPRIGLNPLPLSFTTLQGENPPPQSFTVTNLGGGTLNWSATDNAAWLDRKSVV